MDINTDIHIALLQIKSTPFGQGLPSPATSLINQPIRGILWTLNRLLRNTKNNDHYYEAFKE